MKTLFTMMSLAAFVLTATPAFAVDCVTDADCLEAEVCVEGVCVPNVLECETDADCTEGLVCIDSVCMPDAICETDADCIEGEVCIEGVCMPDYICETDADCLEGEVCEMGMCVPDMPPECDPACGEGETCVDGACVPMGGDNSCYGVCGAQAAGGCYCDEACFGYGDCCEDICDACPDMGECCTPMCDGKECGDDGCGGSCGACDAGFKCEDFACVVCEPSCDGKICGSDGCGGTCGDCPAGESCNAAGTECLPCAGCAEWQVCDADGGCMDPESAGECEYGGEYIAAGCFGVDWIGCCGNGVLYYCDDQSGNCPLGGSCLVSLDCIGQGAGCGWGGDAGFFMCVEGEGVPDAQGNLYCDFYECVPNCDGKVCGGDGCGGSCGDCADGEACSEAGDACVAASCEGFCGEQSPAGCWCDTECAQWGDCCEDRCDLCPEMCADDPCTAACTDKCGMVGDCDCGGCADGEVCEVNACVPDGPCVSDCTGLVCGDDGCGGSCGDCAAGETCELGACVMGGGDEDVVIGIECATDGDCGDGEVCNADGECETKGGNGGGDDEDSGGTCATGDSVPTAGLIVLFGILGLAVIRRRALV